MKSAGETAQAAGGMAAFCDSAVPWLWALDLSLWRLFRETRRTIKRGAQQQTFQRVAAHPQSLTDYSTL